MSMERVTVRLPRDVLAAIDAAEGNRSAIIRRRLSEAVRDGELKNVPEDLKTLAEREAIVESGALDRKRATFKSRCHDFFKGRWDAGGVTGEDADTLAETWRQEAALYGEAHLSYVEAVVGWFRENYDATQSQKPTFPGADLFVAKAADVDVEVDEHLVSVLQNAAEAGADRDDAVKRIRANHDPAVVEAAADRAFSDGGTDR